MQTEGQDGGRKQGEHISQGENCGMSGGGILNLGSGTEAALLGDGGVGAHCVSIL